MIQDIFLPTKLGSYYLFSKHVLSFEITSYSVQASLVYFSKKSIIIKNSMHIILQDHNPITMSNAIKKIATSIGKYDQVVTSINSSAIIFKELTLPFIGREKIDMIIRYEVEPLLPFPLEQAVIDFVITQENKETMQSTVFVAAIRLADLHTHTDYFEKAGVTLTHVTLDSLALYDFYRHAMYTPHAQTSILLVDINVDVLRILYIQKGVLESIRLVPFGLLALIKKLTDTSHHTVQEILELLLQGQQIKFETQEQQEIVEQLYHEVAKQITISISYFQKQVKNFITPIKIICLGAGTTQHDFVEKMSALCNNSVELCDMKKIAARHAITINRNVDVDGQYNSNVIIPLSVDFSDINFLSDQSKKQQLKLLNKQLITAFIISFAMCTSIYFYTHYQLQKWNVEYEKSKKQLIAAINDQMDVDIKNSKRVPDIVAVAENKLQQTKKVCLSFAENQNDYLHYLQELSTQIDREGLGLMLQKISFSDKEISLQGKINDSLGRDNAWTNLTLFSQALMHIKGLTLKNIPPELSFNVTLLIKDDQEEQKDAL